VAQNEYSMEIRHLKLIVSIADEGSITKAAEKLSLTQCALSHQLKELGDNVGLAVFYRVNRKLVPTPANASPTSFLVPAGAASPSSFR
jgi:LysR family transcriptional regulator, regulator for metE and metH